MANESPFSQWVKHKIRSKSVAGRILNTFEELGFTTKHGLEPLLIERKKTDYGWFLRFTLPPSISARDVEAKLHHFSEQAPGHIEMWNKHKTLYFDVCTYEHPEKIPFAFDPAPHLEKMFAPWPIGYDFRGRLLVVDLGDGIYHILVVGTTGAGKSNIIFQWVWSSIQSGFVTCIINTAKREHGMFRNHAILAEDILSARNLLKKLNKYMDQRQVELEKYEAVKIQEYPYPERMPLICVIFDELADFQDKEGIEALQRLLFLGRNAGLFVIGATQRSSAKLFKSESFTELRDKFNGRLCFKVNDRFVSDMALGNDLACHLPTDQRTGKPIPGMAIWQYGAPQTVKTMYFDVKQHRKQVTTLPQPKGVIKIEQPTPKQP